MNKILFWIKNARDIALPQSILPALTALVLCIGTEGFCWWTGILAIAGIAAAHLGMNLADDYFDYKRDSRNRSTLSDSSIRARMEKCAYISSGQTTVHATGKAVAGFLLTAGLTGGIIVAAQYFRQGTEQALAVIGYALAGLAVGISYSGGPLKLSFYGLGELVIGIMFGPLLMLGMQAACTGIRFSLPMLWMSIAIGCLVTNIVYVHSVMEVKADAELGKMTFARLLRHRSIMLVFCGLFTIAPFVILLAGIYIGWWSPWFLLTLLTLPMSVYLLCSLGRFAYGLPTDDNPRWFMGPMGNFDKYRQAGIDWFLIRWLLARNIVTFFCLIIIVTQIVILLCK